MKHTASRRVGNLTLKLRDGHVTRNGERVFKSGNCDIDVTGPVAIGFMQSEVNKITRAEFAIGATDDGMTIAIVSSAIEFPQDSTEVFDALCSSLSRTMRLARQEAKKQPKVPSRDVSPARRRAPSYH